MMREQFENFISFNLFLSAKTFHGKELEAIKKLKNIYPYSLEVKNIYIEESKEKNMYKVYISNVGFTKRPQRFYKLLIAFFSLLFVLALVIFSLKMHDKMVVDKENEKIIKRMMYQKEMKEISLKKKEKESLEKKYLENAKNSYCNLYKQIEVIYSLLPEKTSVEYLNIDSSNFVIDVIAKDCSDLLSNFENCKALSQVKMSRTTVLNKDFSNISGKFVRNLDLPSEDLNVEEKIKFYSEKLKIFENRREKLSSIKISDYIEDLRNRLHENNCKEQYIQLKGENENLEIEMLLYSDGVSILNFISEIQEQDEDMYDIKSFNLKNNENSGRLQSLITFKTGIALNENNNFEYDLLQNSFSTKEISAMLNIPKEVKHNINIQKQNKPVNKQIIIKKTLIYIGLTKMNDQTFIMAKDEEMNIIYKLKYVENDIEGNFCRNSQYGNYIAKINNDWYEVKK